MVSSVLSPEKVVGRQNTNRAATQNFISGGSLLGASVVNSAANKIVGFQRAGVQPAAPAIDSIVSTISTNINNNVNNTVNKTLQGFSADYQRRVKEFDINKITTNITNTVNKTLQGFSTDYQNRIKQVDDAKPIGILGKFLNVYKTALGFINFFGNKKNIDKVRDSLDALKKSFTESFEVAKLIRQVIIKIVKQLSNLPVASPSGGGGLNLDVDIPGGGLKKSAPRGLGRMMGGGKGKMLALGAGALGLGAAGAGAVNALSDSPQAQAAGTSPEIPGDIADRFSSIVDRFANAISKLFETNKQKSNQQQQQQSSGGKGEKKEKEDKTKPPPPGPSPGGVSSGSEDMMTLAAIAALESGSAQGQSDVAQSVYNRLRDPTYKGKSIKDLLTKQGQYQVAFKDPTSRSGPGTEIADEFKNIKNEDDGVKAMMYYYNKRGQKITSEQARQKFRGSVAAIQNPELQKKSAQFVGGRTDFLGYNAGQRSTVHRGSGSDNYFAAEYGNYGQNLKMGAAAVPTGLFTTSPSTVAAAPTKATSQQQIAQQVSQPQAAQVEAAKTAQTQVAQRATAVSQIAQSQPQVNYLPIDMSGGGQQQSGGGGSSGGGGGSQGSGPSVPFLPAGNPNNFLVLYSRMVYNIVDG